MRCLGARQRLTNDERLRMAIARARWTRVVKKKVSSGKLAWTACRLPPFLLSMSVFSSRNAFYNSFAILFVDSEIRNAARCRLLFGHLEGHMLIVVSSSASRTTGVGVRGTPHPLGSR